MAKKKQQLQNYTSNYYLQDEQYQFRNMGQFEQDIQSVFQYCFVAAAQNGGPIALIRNPITDIISQQKLKDKIAFLAQNGEKRQEVEFFSANRNRKEFDKKPLILFEFTDSDRLIILFPTSQYAVMHPNQEIIKLSTSYLDENRFRNPESEIKEARILKRGLVFQTNSNIFYYLHDICKPQPLQIQIDIPLSRWIPILNPDNEVIEILGSKIVKQGDQVHSQGIYYIRTNSNTISTLQDDSLRVLSIAMMPSAQKYAALICVNKNIELHVSSIENRDIDISELNNYDEIIEQYTRLGFIQMAWCGNNSVAIQIQNSVIFTALNEQFSTTIMKKEGNNPQHRAKMLTEVDGLRIITHEQIRLMRWVPKLYSKIFYNKDEPRDIEIKDLPLSCILFQVAEENFEQFEIKDPISNTVLEIFENPDRSVVIQAFDQLYQLASYQLIDERRVLLYKTIAITQRYFPKLLAKGEINRDELQQDIDIWRIIHNIKTNDVYKRAMTYWEFREMDFSNLIGLLLDYDLHMIASYADKLINGESQNQIRITHHWCERVIVRSSDSQAGIFERIKNKLAGLEQKSKIQELALKAVMEGQHSLAMDLLKLPMENGKRIKVLLEMGNQNSSGENEKIRIDFYLRAIEYASGQMDSYLIYKVIKTVWESELDMNTKMYLLLSEGSGQSQMERKNSMNLTHYFKRYLYQFDFENFIKINQKQYKSEKFEIPQLFIQKALQSPDSMIKIANFQKAEEEYKEIGLNNSNEYIFLKERLKEQQLKVNLIQESNRLKEVAGMSVFNKIKHFIQINYKQNSKQVDDIINKLKVENNVSESNMTLLRITVLIDLKQFDDLHQIVMDKNQNQEIIQFELIAQYLDLADQTQQTIQYLKLSNKGVEVVQKLLSQNQIQEAVKYSMSYKNDDKQQVQSYVETKIQQQEYQRIAAQFK